MIAHRSRRPGRQVHSADSDAIPCPPRRPPCGPRDSRRIRLPRGDARQRDRARAKAELGPADRHVSAHDDRRVRARRRPAARADGKFRGRPPQHRRGPRRLPGLHADRPRDRDGRVRAECGAVRRDRGGRAHGTTLHVLGLVSPGGVHSHERQIAAMVEMAAAGGAPRVLVHAFLDGRDTPPQSADASLAALQDACARHSAARIASIVGRYYAMDRDQRWERVVEAYDLIVDGRAAHQAPARRRASRPPTRAARPTSSSGPPRSSTTTAGARRWPTATSSCS